MRPKFELLDRELIGRILDEAFLLLEKHGVRIGDEEALECCDLMRHIHWALRP